MINKKVNLWELRNLEEKHIGEYEINPCTMFLKPFEYGSKIFTKIYEIEDEFLSPMKPIEIIKNSCHYFGCDYESRKRGTRQLTGFKRKIPIVIEPTNSLFFFPTTSPSREECIWIAHDHVENFQHINRDQTLILFQNKQSHLMPVSLSTIRTQMGRTSLFKTKLMKRIENNDRKLTYLMSKHKVLNAFEKPNDYRGENF